MAHGIYGVGDKETGSRSSERGDFGGDDLSHLEVALRLELMESQACWYELLLHPPDWDAKQAVIDRLRFLQASANNPVERGSHLLVCFWAARPKVRFCMSKKPYFGMFSKDFIFYVEQGSQRTRKKLSTTFVDGQTGKAIQPHIELSEGFITISSPHEEPEKVSIHEFLRKCGIELGIGTDIYAVECTSTPLAYWLSGSDRHLAQMLYHVPSDAYDFFLYCNVFKVTLMQMQLRSRLNTVTGNGVWELLDNSVQPHKNGQNGHYSFLPFEKELLIEKTLNAYFELPTSRFPDMRLPKTASVPSNSRPQYSVQVLMELGSPHELYRFGSMQRQALDKHIFSCQINGDELNLSILE